MVLICADLTFSNPAKPDLAPYASKALVDTDALFLCIPAHMAIQLQLTEYERREVTIADRSKRLCPYVGPIRIDYKNRMCLTGALVLGTTVLLGAIPMEDMDLVSTPPS